MSSGCMVGLKWPSYSEKPRSRRPSCSGRAKPGMACLPGPRALRGGREAKGAVGGLRRSGHRPAPRAE
ncbi:hypothetical protein E2562_033719 [Oryza meyeriana var. granulata]|uniref:Uncharacterized protein n=1 Tax=Oryza meyeriana var. granulata TaxID=110450 RepID=A0A6G1CBD5_9ORYZ|nr:hypothetical protein E2562_033719 [Oryza meyeriana var. granulata]